MAQDLLQRAVKPDGAVMNPVARDHEALFPVSESDDFRRRWNDIQAGFVDEPKPSVKKADQLVAQVFAEERSKLESNWTRQALRRYRSSLTACSLCSSGRIPVSLTGVFATIDE